MISLALSIFYATCLVVGTVFWVGEGIDLLERYWIVSIGVWVGLVLGLRILLNKIFKMMDEGRVRKRLKRRLGKKLEEIRGREWFRKFSGKPFLVSFLLMIICWVPYIVAFYPAILSPDPSNQIRQFFGIQNDYYEYVVMIPEGAKITNHHPVVHTLLLGGAAKLGAIVGDINLGLFLYSLIQVAILAATLAYTIKFLKERGINEGYLMLMLGVYSFVPVFPLYGMSVVKDTIFGCLVILYGMKLYWLVKSETILRKEILTTVAIMIGMILLRNNGIHVILLSLPLLLLTKKELGYKAKVLAMAGGVIVFNVVWNVAVLPYFKVTPGSVREKLSIPFQQTARYAKEHGEEVTGEEREVIDKILGYETLAERYKPEISDPVKNGFNKNATKEDLKKYFRVWVEEGVKHPKTYAEATIENTYGYFYPLKTRWYIYYVFDERLNESGLSYHYIDSFEGAREALASYGVAFPYIPVVGWLVNIGVNVWMLVFMVGYLLYRGKRREVIYLVPSLVLVLVCVASPVNCYFRYALPFVFALMVNFGLFLRESKR